MNGISIPLASAPRPPQPINVTLGPANSRPGESRFQGQLNTAIAERKSGAKDSRQENTEEGAKRQTANKKDPGPQQPIVLDASPEPLPPLIAGSFGLPSAGLEPGSSSGDTSSKAEPESNSVAVATALNPTLGADSQTPVLSVASTLQMKPPAASTEAIKSEPPAQLAFALRLWGQPSNPEPQRPIDVGQPPATARQSPANTGQSPNNVTQSNNASAPLPLEIHVVPGESAAPNRAVQPDGTVRPAVRTILPSPASTVVGAPGAQAVKPGGPPPESGSYSGGGNSPDQGAAKGTPKPDPQLSELKFQREPSPAPEPAIRAVKESPSEASNVSLPAPTPAPIAPGATQTSSGAATASLGEQISGAPVAAVQPTPASKVTDISVSVSIPRPDASTDDRIAIRMVQTAGGEVHVSVRTLDTQVAQSLRQDLGKLSTGLDQAGFHTETWRPTAINAGAPPNADPRHDPSQGSPNRDGSDQNARSPGQGSGGSGEQRRRQQDDRPRWVAELEQQTNQ